MNQLHEQIRSETNPEINRLLSIAHKLYPSLKGQIGDHQVGGIRFGQNNNASITKLYHCMETRHPEASQPYWSIRTWTLLVWQPIYLALIGVHQLNIMPPLDNISQIQADGNVAGFYIQDHAYHRSHDNDLIKTTAQLLKQVCDALFEELSRITRIRRISAMRLVADTLLAALNRLQYSNTQLTNKQIINLADLWLSAMDLEGQSHFMPITLSSGREQLVLNRKGCCMHYRRQNGDLCASCPKQKMPIRVERLSAAYNTSN